MILLRLPELDYSDLNSVNVHGDFSPRNLTQIKNKFFVIDLEMAHKGYLELEFIKLINHLSKFGSRDFFKYLKNNGLRLNSRSFRLFLRHKLMDLSVIKSAYFSSNKKYLELKKHISSTIQFNKNLIKNMSKYEKKFDTICK